MHVLESPVLSASLHRWGKRQGQGDDSGIAGTGLNELRRLRNILSQNELVFDLVIDLEILHSGHCRSAIGGMFGIGDGNLLDRRFTQDLQSLGEINVRPITGPQDNPPDGIGIERARHDETGFFQFLWGSRCRLKNKGRTARHFEFAKRSYLTTLMRV